MKKPLPWVPWHVDSWIYGSSRIELSRAQRSDFVDLVLLSAKDSGWIRANETTPYPLGQLAGMLSIKPEDLQETIERCIEVRKITRDENGTLYITNYERYRLTPRYRRKLEHGSGSSDSSSSKEIKKSKEEESKPGRKSGPMFPKRGTGPSPPGKQDLDKDGLLPIEEELPWAAKNELTDRRAEIRRLSRLVERACMHDGPSQLTPEIIQRHKAAFNDRVKDFS